MQKIEYLIRSLGISRSTNDHLEILNEVGQKGWKLSNKSIGSQMITYIFEKEIIKEQRSTVVKQEQEATLKLRGERILLFRLKNKISQQALAKRIGLNQLVISNAEKGLFEKSQERVIILIEDHFFVEKGFFITDSRIKLNLSLVDQGEMLFLDYKKKEQEYRSFLNGMNNAELKNYNTNMSFDDGMSANLIYNRKNPTE